MNKSRNEEVEEVIYRSQDGFEIAEDKEGNEGWRVGINKQREKVRFYFTFGWYTEEEMTTLRQKYPRSAP